MDKDIIELQFGDELLPVKFGFNALEEIIGAGGEQWSKGGLANIRRALHIGLKHGFEARGLEFTISDRDAGNLIDKGPESSKVAWKKFLEASELYMGLFKDEDEE